MPPEATEPNADPDIFVEDPTGAFVAGSTSGGTDELVDIVLPMDGTWTVWVHGWSAPGGDSDYDMWTWAVPLASGGSLSVDSAPRAAVVGDVGTIDVSWSGLTSGSTGGWYLGAVSHTGDSGLMGLTLVNVDNRSSIAGGDGRRRRLAGPDRASSTGQRSTLLAADHSLVSAGCKPLLISSSLPGTRD